MADETTPNGTSAPEPTAAPAAPVQPEKTFSQEEVNRILAEEKRKHKGQYADYDQLKAAAAELAQLKEAQLSEAEKLQRQLEEIKTAKAQVESRARDTLVRAAIISEAAKLNFNDPEDAYRLIDMRLLTVTDDQVEGVSEAVKALAESRKYLLKTSNPALTSFNPAAGDPSPRETDAQRRARLYSGGGQQFFDPNAAARAGGGLVWPKPPE